MSRRSPEKIQTVIDPHADALTTESSGREIGSIPIQIDGKSLSPSESE
jgi:hypothetical protein